MAKGDRPLNMSPGIIKGRKYVIYNPEDGQYPRPVLKGRTYAVGQLDTPLAFGSRAWSYLMERYTTSKALKADIKAEEWVGESVHRGIEDLRLLSLVLGGKTSMPDFAKDAIVSAYAENRKRGYGDSCFNLPMLSLLYLAHHGLDDTKETCPNTILSSGIKPRLDKIARFVRENCTDPGVTKIAAQMFVDLFTKPDTEGAAPRIPMDRFYGHFNPRSARNPYLSQPCESAVPMQSVFGSRYSFGSDCDTERIERLIREEQRLNPVSGSSSVTFNIVELPMPIVHHRDRTRGYAASDFGVVPRYISRYMWGPMFTVKAKRVGGGTVLIDNSGSMGYRSSEIAAIVQGVPAATIASYNGKGNTGTLFILAKGGRMATPEKMARASVGGGNIVDYPSLLWLRMQRGPRVWVSDGGVTGEGDRSYEGINRSCAEVVRKSKIVRVLDGVTEIIRLLKEGR